MRPCIHSLFPCDLFPCAVVTRTDDGGRNHTTSQQHYDPVAIYLTSLFLRLCKGINSEKESSRLAAGS